MKNVFKVIGALLLLGLIAIGINILAAMQDISGCQQA